MVPDAMMPMSGGGLVNSGFDHRQVKSLFLAALAACLLLVLAMPHSNGTLVSPFNAAYRMQMLSLDGRYSEANALALQMLQDTKASPLETNSAAWTLVMNPGGNAWAAVKAMAKVELTQRDADLMDTYAWGLYVIGDRAGALAAEKRALSMCTSMNVNRSYFEACVTAMNGDVSGGIRKLEAVHLQNTALSDCDRVADLLRRLN